MYYRHSTCTVLYDPIWAMYDDVWLYSVDEIEVGVVGGRRPLRKQRRMQRQQALQHLRDYLAAAFAQEIGLLSYQICVDN